VQLLALGFKGAELIGQGKCAVGRNARKRRDHFLGMGRGAFFKRSGGGADIVLFKLRDGVVVLAQQRAQPLRPPGHDKRFRDCTVVVDVSARRLFSFGRDGFHGQDARGELFALGENIAGALGVVFLFPLHRELVMMLVRAALILFGGVEVFQFVLAHVRCLSAVSRLFYVPASRRAKR